MIYLSGKLQVNEIGNRLDIGLMVGFRGKGDFNGQAAHVGRCLWAADNGCFTNDELDIETYLGWLGKMAEFQENCLFATAPDVVGNAKETWYRSKGVLPLIRKLGYPAALVAQDGIEDEVIHWDTFDCLFIGGSTEFKLSGNMLWLCREAAKQGKWVHMGRVNSKRRLLTARFSGCHSADGTMMKHGPDINLAKLKKWLDFINAQPVLNF